MSAALSEDVLRTLMLTLDLGGTFAFALSGAVAGTRRRLDLFGVLVLSVAAATFGGIARDLLIGAVPPAALVDWRYLAVSVAAGLITFFWTPLIERLRNPVRMMDAMGLALFAVAGTEKALAFGLSPVMAALLGMITGIGGGVARDVLLSDIPVVLRSELYAVAALAGASVVVAGHLFSLPIVPTVLAGGAVCFALRMQAIRRGWQLPVPREIVGDASGQPEELDRPR
ncbi:MAG TPA: trimeric intracellular cation channel family protein [Trueperaceae bacterium]|nr:trimeric intracellular cation channel family protein [Trueperaceae bacterium]